MGRKHLAGEILDFDADGEKVADDLDERTGSMDLLA
jgi:hypothetical protein